MNIAVISDIHDRTDHLQFAIESIREHGCSHIICLGDICSPYTLKELIEQTHGIPLDIVMGNNDFEIKAFQRLVSPHSRISLFEEKGKTIIDGLRIGFIHLPYSATAMAHSGQYDCVLYGHTHLAHQTSLNHCLLANPGEIMGRTGTVSYGILETKSRTFSIIPILP